MPLGRRRAGPGDPPGRPYGYVAPILACTALVRFAGADSLVSV